MIEIAAVYLVLVFPGTSGALALPMESEATCEDEAKAIQAAYKLDGGVSDVFAHCAGSGFAGPP